MAVIIQADPYSCLIRKIGYSVGLEMLVERVKRLVSLYKDDRSISLAAFRTLIEDDFGRKKATEHFANFYGTLNLVRLVGRDIQPLYQLDSLSMLRRLFESDEGKFDVALRLVLTQCILEADGDIFLNGLLCDFEAEEMKVLLEAMVEAKYGELRNVIHSGPLLTKLSQIINIKNESANETSARQASGPQGRFGKRTEALSVTRRTVPLSSESRRVVNVPADYLDKSSKTRKAWAQDLHLFADGAKTDRGRSLLESLQKMMALTKTERQALLFWPYKSELSRIRISPESIGAATVEAWDLLCALVKSGERIEPSPSKPSLNPDEVIDLLRRFYHLYRESNSSMGLIRNNLPFYVAEPVLAAWCASEEVQMPALGDILEVEYHKKTASRVQKMIIRGTTGALFFMR